LLLVSLSPVGQEGLEEPMIGPPQKRIAVIVMKRGRCGLEMHTLETCFW